MLNGDRDSAPKLQCLAALAAVALTSSLLGLLWMVPSRSQGGLRAQEPDPEPMPQQSPASGETEAEPSHSDAPEEETSAAEKAFRSGEVLRARGDGEAARAAFLQAWKLGAQSEFRTRAQLELGHLRRRSKQWSLALDRYFDLSHDESARREDRDAALYWQGVVWQELSNLDAARRSWKLVARDAVRVLDRVRAFDRLARLEFNCGNPSGACAVLAACDEALSPAAAELTSLGSSIRGALARMWSRRALASLRSVDESESDTAQD